MLYLVNYHAFIKVPAKNFIIFFSLLLVFSESSRYVSVSEPLSGMTTVTLNVTREGGALGLAFVDYNVTSASG